MQFLINRVVTKEQALELIYTRRYQVSIDIETISLSNLLPLGIAVGISGDTGFYFFNPKDSLLHTLIDHTPTCIFHNSKFDIPILKELGYTIQDYEDTKLIAYSSGILDNSLEELSQSQLNRECPSVTSQWKKPNQGNIAIDHAKMGEMSIIHACNTYALWENLTETPLYLELDKPCIELLMEMEKWGLLVDQYKLTEVEQGVITRVNQLETELKAELGDINLASNPQIVVALQAKGVLGTRKTKSGKDSVSEESLKPLNHPLANKILRWRSEMKTLTTYLPPFRNPDSGGRIHTRFGYTNTGRWTSSEPNLQNLTRDEKFIVEGE